MRYVPEGRTNCRMHGLSEHPAMGPKPEAAGPYSSEMMRAARAETSASVRSTSMPGHSPSR